MGKLEQEIRQREFQNAYQKTIVNVLYTSNWISYQTNQLLKDYGLSAQQYNVLRILRGQFPEPASVGLIISRMLDKMSNASRLVEKLRIKGLVERKESKKDRRQVDVIITKRGLNLLKKLDTLFEGFEQRLHILSEEEATMLNDLLDKLRG